MDVRKVVLIAVGIAVAIGLAAFSIFAIIGGVVLAVLVRLAMWAMQPKDLADDGVHSGPVKDENGMIDITSKGKVL